MSVEDYNEKFNILLDEIRNINFTYQLENFPDILKEKNLKKEINNHVSDGPKNCLEFRDISFRNKKVIDRKYKEKPPDTSVKIDDIDKFLDDEVAAMYNRPWCKLDKVMKKKKLIEYCSLFSEKNNLNNDSQEKFLDLILNEYKKENLNKKSDVDYDDINATIISLKNLIIDDQNEFFFKEKKKTK